MAIRIQDILDLERYPLHQPAGRAYSELVASRQSDWRTGGACALPGLIRREMAQQAVEELRQPMDTISFRHRQAHNIYFSDDIDNLPQDLSERRLITTHRTLTCDQLAGTIIRAVYEWDPLRAFIQRVLELPQLYPMVDPMACLNVMAYGEGDELGWHFDRARFAVTILLQAAVEGGQFEYRRALRTATDANHAGVRRLLAGEDDSICQARPAPGDMTVFSGFGSAHRVAPVMGDTPRVMAVLSYMTEPGYQYGPEDRLRFYGRTSPDDAPTWSRSIRPATSLR
jgi:hypothetical protein